MIKRQIGTSKKTALEAHGKPPPPRGGVSRKHTQVFPRDASFNPTGRGGSASKYHWEGEDCASRCGRARILRSDAGLSPSHVPEILRCKARGCAESWRGWAQFGTADTPLATVYADKAGPADYTEVRRAAKALVGDCEVSG
jgi:hypothetical protein